MTAKVSTVDKAGEGFGINKLTNSVYDFVRITGLRGGLSSDDAILLWVCGKWIDSLRLCGVRWLPFYARDGRCQGQV